MPQVARVRCKCACVRLLCVLLPVLHEIIQMKVRPTVLGWVVIKVVVYTVVSLVYTIYLSAQFFASNLQYAWQVAE